MKLRTTLNGNRVRPNSTCSNEKTFLISSGLAFVRYVFINIADSGSSPSVLANIR